MSNDNFPTIAMVYSGILVSSIGAIWLVDFNGSGFALFFLITGLMPAIHYYLLKLNKKVRMR